MSLQVLEDVCIGCGACDFSCPTGALTKTDSFLGLFEIDPFTCNDCGLCVPKCPERAIVADPAWPVCARPRLPTHEQAPRRRRMRLLARPCPSCGTTMWRHDERTKPKRTSWACPRCGWHMKVVCPKTRKLEP